MLIPTEQLDSLRQLNFPLGSWCVVGGLSLAIRGIRRNKNDVDLLVTDELYSLAEKDNSWIECALSENGERVTLVKENSFPPIELLPLSNFIDTRSVNQSFIDKADIIEGLPVIRASDMLIWKREVNRPKDRVDIALLEKYIANTH